MPRPQIWPEGKPLPQGSVPFRKEITEDGQTVILSGFVTPDGIMVVVDIDTVNVDKEDKNG